MPDLDVNSFLESMVKFVEDKCLTDETPEIPATIARLENEGCQREEAIRLIANLCAIEMLFMQKDGQPFNDERFQLHLNKLPQMPWG
jgi:hypothetical protein